jgi:hypothetical protein
MRMRVVYKNVAFTMGAASVAVILNMLSISSAHAAVETTIPSTSSLGIQQLALIDEPLSSLPVANEILKDSPVKNLVSPDNTGERAPGDIVEHQDNSFYFTASYSGIHDEHKSRMMPNVPEERMISPQFAPSGHPSPQPPYLLALSSVPAPPLLLGFLGLTATAYVANYCYRKHRSTRLCTATWKHHVALRPRSPGFGWVFLPP